MTQSYYRSLGDGHFASTELTEGAWSPDEQHMAVATGLLVRELEAFEGGEGTRLCRISLDIFGMIRRGECEIDVRVVRPGRRISLLEAEWRSGGRTAIVARGWRLATEDTREALGTEDAPMPGPDEATPHTAMAAWPGAFLRSLEVRVLPGWRPGRGQTWLRTGTELVEGGTSSTLARLAGMMDVANGLAPRVAPGGTWSYPNVDLQIHLHRAPRGEWLGVDVTQQYGPDGIGLTSAVLHDLDGPFGRSEQILLVRPGGH